MKKFNLVVFSLLCLIGITTACCGTKKGTESIYWINGSQVDCVGVGPRKCLQVQKGDVLGAQEWQNFYANIEGFEFEPGFIYKLKINEVNLPKEEVPADGSSIKFTLVEVLEKNLDTRFAIDGDWTLTRIDTLDINMQLPVPTLIINVSDMLISGNGGCNNYNASIKTLAADSIVLNHSTASQRACIHENMEHQYFIALNKITNYQVEDDKLTFFNAEGVEVLAFVKAAISAQ
ncbi:MAG: DUF4377 domain-containing protein [Mangrovibacterium sp.]